MEPEAAVALIECTAQNGQILIIERSVRDDDPWSGHLALPGGRREKGDSDLLETCLRETFEEIGIQLRKEDLVRPLEPVTALRGRQFPVLVQPFWFKLDTQPKVTIEKNEVSRVLFLPITHVKTENSVQWVKTTPRDQLFPAVQVEDRWLWGFTYEVLRRFFATHHQIELPSE